MARTVRIWGTSAITFSLPHPPAQHEESYTLGGCSQEYMAPCRPQLLVRGCGIYAGECCQHCLFSVTEAQFQVSAAERLRAPFLHPAPILRVKALPQAQQAQNTGVSIPSPTHRAAVPCQERQTKEARLPLLLAHSS